MLSLNLSPAQERVYRGVVSGHSNRRIAGDAGIAEKTVKTHLTAILKKAMCGTRCELIVAHYTLQKEPPQC